MVSDYCVRLLLLDLVLRPLVLDGSDGIDLALIPSWAGSVWAPGSSVMLVLRIFTYFLLQVVPSSCPMLGIMLDYIHRVMLDNV